MGWGSGVLTCVCVSCVSPEGTEWLVYVERGRLVFVVGKPGKLFGGWGESLKGAACVLFFYPTLFRLACLKAGVEEWGSTGWVKGRMQLTLKILYYVKLNDIKWLLFLFPWSFKNLYHLLVWSDVTGSFLWDPADTETSSFTSFLPSVFPFFSWHGTFLFLDGHNVSCACLFRLY